MNLWNTFQHKRRETHKPTKRDFPFLHSAERFRVLLQTERLRADRAKMEFALVVFHSAGKRPSEMHRGSSSPFRRFAAALKLRMRFTDYAGFCGETGEDVGVLLWDTDGFGVDAFLRSLRELVPAADFPRFEIYHYPSEPPYFDDDPPFGNEERAVIRRDNLHEPLPRTKPLEVMFLQRLPWWKRGLDVLGAALGLVLLSPLMLLTAALIKLTSRGPVFFQQQRDGLGGRPFTIYKFRTMHADAEARKAELRSCSEQDGPAFKMTSDPRTTTLGRYLRKTCLDELPQLWNVLKGDMTLVGPRPLESQEARQITGFGRRRMEVTPGLTCIWQVEGKSRVSFVEWMRMDVRYLAGRRFLRDLKLIGRTAVSMLLHRASV